MQDGFAAMAFAQPTGADESNVPGPSIKLIIWQNGTSITLNVPEAGAVQMADALEKAIEALAVARELAL